MAAMGNGLHAALKLARGRADGLDLLGATPSDASMDVAARSFWAMALCVPALLALHLIGWVETGIPADATLELVRDIAGYVVGWLGFAALSHVLAQRLGRAGRWPRFVTIWNWCNVVQYLMLVASALPGLLGLPDWIGETVWLVALGWALWLEWFATRLALDVSGPTAAGLVALDLALGLFLSALSG